MTNETTIHSENRPAATPLAYRPQPITAERLDAIWRRAMAADPSCREQGVGWEAACFNGDHVVGMAGNLDTQWDAVLTLTGGMILEEERPGITEFVAAAYNDVPDLVLHIRTLEAELARLRSDITAA